MSFVQTFFLRLFGLLFIFIAPKSPAQQKGWQEVTISDGLSQGMIHEIKQDEYGFMWIGTNDGLNRYDGHNFKVFTHDPYDEYSISGNVCTALFIDSRKRLWVGTQAAGLNLYNRATNRFYHIDIKTKSKLNSHISYINEDPQGNIWLSCFDGELFKINLNNSLTSAFPAQANFTNEVTILRVGSLSPTRVVSPFAFDPKGLAYICDKDVFYTLDWKNPTKLSRLQSNSAEIPFTFFQKQSKQSRLWMTPATLAMGAQKEKALYSLIEESRKHEISLTTAANGNLIICHSQHLWLIENRDELLSKNPLSPIHCLTVFPKTLTITTCFEDNRGNIWVGTNGYGLRKFNPRIKQFHWYLPGRSLGNIYQDKQGRCYAKERHHFQLLNKQNNTTREIFEIQLSTPANVETYDLTQDRANHFWLAVTVLETTGKVHYIAKYSPELKLEKKYPMPAGLEWSEPGVRIIEDRTGKLWLTANNGKLLHFDPTNESSKLIDYSHLAPTTPMLKEATGMYQDRSGLFWVGTRAGLIKMDISRDTPQFSLFSNSIESRKTLSNNYVSALIDDPYQPQKFLWVCTKGGGLERLDKQTGTFEHFTEKQGLPNKVVYGILEDEHKNLWMSTNRGLSQLNPKTLTFKNYTKEDGLQDDEFNTNSFFKAPTGELLFGGLNGLNIFRASDIQSNGIKPTVQIVGLKINNEEIEAGDETHVLSESIENTESITLAHDQNQLSFELAVMDLTNPAKNRYRYRLPEISKTWIEVGTNRIINFSQLSSGTHKLQVSGSVNGEFWSDRVTLKVRIKPPFYDTWWAYLVYIALTAALIWRWNQSRTHRLLLQQELVFKEKEAYQMAELDELKTRFFTNISHEFRTPLTLILNLVADLDKKYPNDTLFVSLKRNSQRLLSLINQLLDLSKLDSGQLSIHIQKGDLARFIQELTEGFGLVAQNLSIDFQFTQNRREVTACFDADFMEKILTNLLSNALKFTKKGGKIGLFVEYSASLDAVKIIVKDDGIGISTQKAEHIFERFYQADGTQKRAYEGTGIGLALVKEIVDLYRGTISVQSLEGIGTTFTVTLPIGEQTWKDELAMTNTETIQYRSIEAESLAAVPANEITPTLPIPTSEDENILLLVEDNTELRHYIRSIFEREYRIIEAVDGQDGLEKALQTIPDLVICDVMMPRIDGFEFCQRLKTDEKTNHIPVLMLTAKTNILSKIQGHEMGADNYLTKPFYREELMVIVNNLILQRNTLRQKYEMKAVSLKPDEVKINSLEERFMVKAKNTIESHITESSFNVEQFALDMHVTPVVLRRKIKALTNQTVTEYVRNYRLQRAADLLRKHGGTVTEIAFQVGFENVSYFGKVFQDVYGKSPSEFSKEE